MYSPPCVLVLLQLQKGKIASSCTKWKLWWGGFLPKLIHFVFLFHPGSKLAATSGMASSARVVQISNWLDHISTLEDHTNHPSFILLHIAMISVAI